MYVPKHFAEQRLDVLQATINQIGFGSLVSLAAGPGGRQSLCASHIPMHVEERPGTLGVLRGHLAKANGQWRDFVGGVPFLAMFVGAEGYISPSLYPSKREHGRVVPTWNYIAVHAHGTPEFFEEPRRLHELVSMLTGLHEDARDTPWHVTDAPVSYIGDQLKGIVGFEMPIDEIQGKWKLAQNRSLEDRRGVMKGLRAEGPAHRDLADAVAETLGEQLVPKTEA
jgi:transcriptional regulator